MRDWVRVTAIVGALGSGRFALGQSNPRYAIIDQSKLLPPNSRLAIGIYGTSPDGRFYGGPIGTSTFSRALLSDGIDYVIRQPLPGFETAGIVDVNRRGEAAAVSAPDAFDYGYFHRRGVFYDRGGMPHEIGTLGGDWSEAFAVNDDAVVVGESEFVPGTGQFMAFAWQNGVLKALQQPPGGNGISSANGINDDGVIVGFAFSPTGRPPCRWVNGVYEALRSLRSDGALLGGEAYAINDFGQIVGHVGGGAPGPQATMWEGDAVTDLDDPDDGNDSYAFDINNLTQVVGYAVPFDEDEPDFGWIWEGGGPGLIRLDSLTPPLSWNAISHPEKINDESVIIGYGYKSDATDFRYFFLVPVTPAFTMEQIEPGIAGQQNTITVTGLTPGERVKVYFSDKGGGALIPGCTMTEAALQIENPQFAATITADGSGTATLTRNISASYAGKTVLLQAADVQDCRVSTLLVQRIE